MESWSAKRLGNLCLRVSSGGTPLRSVPEYYENGTIPWLKTGEVKKGLIYDTEEKITENGLENSSTKLIPANSVIVAMYGDGDTAGNVAINKVPLTTNQACCNFTLNPEQANYRFVYYYLKGSYNNLINLKLGGSQQNLNAQSLKSFPINHPAVKTQKKIAAILSAYDELVENNQRRIALLEKMAEEIYREWFVRLRFPRHEKVKIVKGVPESWKLVRLESAFKFTGGGTPTKQVTRYWDNGDVNWFTPSDITGAKGIFLEQSDEQCSEEGFNNSSAKMFPANSVMLTSRATIGAVGINLTPACTNQGFITCIPNARYPLPYLYHWIKLAKPHFELLSGGATFAELTKRTFKRIEILTPPEPIVTEFARIESPLFEAIENHLRANRKLTETRDKLLPRLISGKLSVENHDIQFPPSMKEPIHEI